MITNNSSVGDLSKVLSPIEGIQLDPKSERLSEAERYAKFNAIAMDYMPPVAQAASGSTGTSGSTSSTTTTTPATNTPPPDDDDDDDNDDDGAKAKKKTNPFQGLADGFNTYAATIAQTDAVEYDEKGFAINKNKITDKPAPFTVEHRKGHNSGALVSNNTSGTIGADKDVLVNKSTGEEKTLKTVYKASF